MRACISLAHVPEHATHADHVEPTHLAKHVELHNYKSSFGGHGVIIQINTNLPHTNIIILVWFWVVW